MNGQPISEPFDQRGRTSINRRSFLMTGGSVGAAAFAACGLGRSRRTATTPTNLVLIMTDNHGPWTLGSYGNPDILTPHIDRMANEGARFTSAYSSNAVCSPTRATFLTGLIPSQHGVHSFLAGGEPQLGEGAYSTIAEFRSLGEILADAGYACGLSGKWHLGDNLNPQEGFSSWITKPHGASAEFYDQEVIEDGRIRQEPQYLTDLWTDRGVAFIEANKQGPFFLFLAYNGPYGLGRLLLNESRNRHRDFYADKELPSFPREEPHPWLFNNREYINNPVSIRRYAAEISGIDDGVGRILETLATHDLDKNTLVVFTADQGLAGGHGGFWGMGDHTRPLSAFDWTMHIPLIFRQPGTVSAGRTPDILVSNYDFLPTVLGQLGLGETMPAQPKSPGRDFSKVLSGERIDAWDDTVFFELENVRAIRTRDWKLIVRFTAGPNELYHLAADPRENQNRYDDPEALQVRDELRKRLDAFFDEYVDPQYDLWKGGRSKAPIHYLREG
jgi:arylsulfatase A-like enzyme